ncbi:hypothetical protein [Rhizobium leguminosarum]|uniref:hypothetical protein n=1 Tax=Rhizobium leguminosarum TaxID=384 RepID=UPI0013EEBB0A|nr:hypothetical protein [Rhizobium leguminosarum]
MIQIKVCVPWLLLEVRRRDEAVRGFDSDGFFALAGETGLLQRHRPRALGEGKGRHSIAV